MSEKHTYRASECGYCPRRLGYQRLNYEALPTPSWLTSSAEEGNWHEKRIKDELKKDSLVDREQEEVKLEYPNFILMGHIDGVYMEIPKGWCPENPDQDNSPKEQLLEIKSMSPFEFDRWMKGRFNEFPAYADQLTAYMEATRLKEALYIVKNRSSGYKDIQIIKEQPTNFENIVQRLTRIEQLAQVGELFQKEFDPDNWECKRCEYRQQCMPPLPILAEDQEKVLFEATENWRRGKTQASEGYKLMDDAKAILRSYAEATPTQRLVFNGIMTRIYAVHTVSYPREEIEKLLSKDILAGIARIGDRFDCRVEDLEKREASNGS